MTKPKRAALLSFWRRVTSPSPRWIRMGRRYGIGHRAAFLIAFGVLFFAIGVGIFLVQTAPSTRPPDPLLFHLRVPLPLRVLLWCGTGGAAIALARSARWQWIGFVALAVAPVERIFSYGAAFLLACWPGGAPGSMGAYLTMGVLFGAVLFVTRLISSWPDPPGDVAP